MKQAFPMGAIASLAGLFDGSNRVRGQMDAARARQAAAEADMAEHRAKLRDPSFMREQALLNNYGGDADKVGKIKSWQQSESFFNSPPQIQGNGGEVVDMGGVQLPSLFAHTPESPLTPAGGLPSAIGMVTAPSATGDALTIGQQKRPEFYTANDEQAVMRQFQNLNMGGLFGMNGRMAVQNQLDYENQDKESLYQAAAMNMLRQGNVDGANAITSVSQGKTYLPNRMTSNGIIYNQATGGFDESSGTAQTNIALKGSQVGLNNERAYSEQFGRQKTAVEIEKLKIEAGNLLQKGEIDKAAFLLDINKDAFMTPQIGADGQPMVDPLTQKPIMAFDQQGYARAVNGALQSGLPANVMRAREIGNTAQLAENKQRLFTQLRADVAAGRVTKEQAEARLDQFDREGR